MSCVTRGEAAFQQVVAWRGNLHAATRASPGARDGSGTSGGAAIRLEELAELAERRCGWAACGEQNAPAGKRFSSGRKREECLLTLGEGREAGHGKCGAHGEGGGCVFRPAGAVRGRVEAGLVGLAGKLHAHGAVVRAVTPAASGQPRFLSALQRRQNRGKSEERKQQDGEAAPHLALMVPQRRGDAATG